MSQESPVPSTTPVDLPALEPVASAERLSSLDILRGFALLGILLMNITSFGFPWNGNADLASASSIADPNLAVWTVISVLFEGKMRATFSMLFGAGLVLFTERAERRQVGAAEVYYHRVLWLLLIGFLHFNFLWDGDILYEYAVGGLLLYPLRRLLPKFLLLAALVLVLFAAVRTLPGQWDMEEKRVAALEAKAAEASGTALTAEQRDAIDGWAAMMRYRKPNETQIAKEIAEHQQGYWSLFLRRQRLGWVTGFQSSWDTAGMMLLGMGLMKLGIFSAARIGAFYWLLMLLGYAVGLTINGITAYRSIHANFEPIGLWWNFSTYDLGRLTMALGHIGLLVLIFQAGRLRWLTSRLAAVGQLALSNYLMQSVICTTIFYGYGFGLYGKLERYQLYFVVLGVWVVQLAISPIWLRYFRFGPVEWIWRSLTYRKWQSMRVTQETHLAA